MGIDKPPKRYKAPKYVKLNYEIKMEIYNKYQNCLKEGKREFRTDIKNSILGKYGYNLTPRQIRDYGIRAPKTIENLKVSKNAPRTEAALLRFFKWCQLNNKFISNQMLVKQCELLLEKKND